MCKGNGEARNSSKRIPKKKKGIQARGSKQNSSYAKEIQQLIYMQKYFIFPYLHSVTSKRRGPPAPPLAPRLHRHNDFTNRKDPLDILNINDATRIQIVQRKESIFLFDSSPIKAPQYANCHHN